MKNFLFLLLISLGINFIFLSNVKAQEAQVTMTNSNNTVTVSIKTDANASGTFTEFNASIRYAKSAGITLTVSNSYYSTVSSNNTYTDPDDSNFEIQDFGFVNTGAASESFTSGVDYPIFDFDITGGTGTGTVQIAIETNTFNPAYFYMALDQGATDLTNYTTPIYGLSTSTASGGGGRAWLYGDLASVPLPVELISFNVFKEANDAMLSWATASEKDNSHFEVERSTDGRQWTTVGTVNGNGTSTARHHYSYADQNVYNGRGTQTFYYRLRQVDYNGAHEYTHVRLVNFSAEDRVTAVSLSPNPTTDRVQVSITGYTGRFTATFIDGNGRIAGAFTGSGSQLVVPVARMKGGTYTVKVTTPAGEVLGTQRLVVVR